MSAVSDAENPLGWETCLYEFPDPEQADPEGIGLIAIGGDLSPSTVLTAYRQGLFPWFNDDEPLAWWSPDPRCVLEPCEFMPSKSLRKQVKKSDWTWTVNHDFEAVMLACREPRDYTNETWINPQMLSAYLELHKLEFAHSIEVWQTEEGKQQLIGGLYGLKIGGLFCGESMFHRQSNASKVAFWALTTLCQNTGVKLIDCQLPNDHLHSLGAIDIPRSQFLSELPNLVDLAIHQTNKTWLTSHSKPVASLYDS